MKHHPDQTKSLNPSRLVLIWSLVVLCWLALLYFDIIEFQFVAIAGFTFGILVAWIIDRAIDQRRSNR